MATVFDIAAGIRSRLGSIDPFRLNQLVFYVQAWSLVHRGRPAFNDRIEAWKDGPVARSLWTDMRYHEGRRLDPSVVAPLSPEDEETVEQVLFHYGQMSSGDLIRLTHEEDPWRLARGGLPDGATSENEITVESIREYYSRAWREASDDNTTAMAPPAFSGTIDELEAMLGR